MDTAQKRLTPDFDVDDVLRKLTLTEKVALLSGRDTWHTNSVPRLGILSLKVSDGPNGVRGIKFFNGTPAACLPCGKLCRRVSSIYAQNSC